MTLRNRLLKVITCPKEQQVEYARGSGRQDNFGLDGRGQRQMRGGQGLPAGEVKGDTMKKEMIEQYLEACALAGMEPSSVKLVESSLHGFAEFCEKREKAQTEKARLYMSGQQHNGQS